MEMTTGGIDGPPVNDEFVELCAVEVRKRVEKEMVEVIADERAE